MKLSKALMIAALGICSLNMVACASTPMDREPAAQEMSATDHAADPMNNPTFEEKMAIWEDHHTGALLHR